MKENIKETYYDEGDYMTNVRVSSVVENGIKITKAMDEWVNTERIIEDAIQNGVLVKPGLESHQAFKIGSPIVDKFFTVDDVENTIQNGVRHASIGWAQYNNVDDVMERGVRHIQPCSNWTEQKVNRVLENGVRETKSLLEDDNLGVDIAIEEGIKHTTPGGYLGFTTRKGKTIHQFEHAKQIDEMNNVIDNGVKYTHARDNNEYWSQDPIENGVKTTKDGIIVDQRVIDEILCDGTKKNDDTIRNTEKSVVNLTIGNKADLEHTIKDIINNYER